MAFSDPSAVATGITVIIGALGWLGAIYERIRNAKVAKKREENAEALSDAKRWQERGDLMAKLAEEYKARLEQEHKEYTEYRAWSHDKAGKDQQTMLKLQEKIADLQSRPDFSDLFDHLKTQSDVSVKILHGIEGMVAMMSKLLDRDSIMHRNQDAQ